MFKSLPYQIAYPTRLQVFAAVNALGVLCGLVAGALYAGIVIGMMLMTIIATGAVVAYGLFPELFHRD